MAEATAATTAAGESCIHARGLQARALGQLNWSLLISMRQSC